MNKISINEQLELRVIDIEHASAFYQLIDKNRLYLRKWLAWLDKTNSVEDLVGFINRVKKDIDAGEALCFLIWRHEEILGIIHLVDIDKNNKKSAIGYWIGEEFRGKGIVMLACKAILDYAFKQLLLNKIEIRCASENFASKAIPEKLGFLKDGVLRDNEFLYDHFVDHHVYSMLAKDWAIKN